MKTRTIEKADSQNCLDTGMAGQRAHWGMWHVDCGLVWIPLDDSGRDFARPGSRGVSFSDLVATDAATSRAP